jgi:hypothetical protein
MALRASLDDQSFDPETLRLMGVAFEIALAALRPLDCPDPIREGVARKIIELAKAGERDPERLCEGALKLAACSQRSASRFTAAGFSADTWREHPLT